MIEEVKKQSTFVGRWAAGGEREAGAGVGGDFTNQ